MKRQTQLGKGRASLGRLTLLTLAAAAGAAAAGQPVTGIEVVGQVTLSLMLVIAVLLVLAWAMRRLSRFQSQTASRLQVLGGLRLGAREQILLVEAEGRRILVGVSPGGLRTLLVFAEGTAREASAQAETSFSVKEFP